jgi:hypothetical protein
MTLLMSDDEHGGALAEPPRRHDGARRRPLQAPQAASRQGRRRALHRVPGRGRRRAALPLLHPKGARRM